MMPPFLTKPKLTIHGAVTNVALLLLGLPESTSLLSPAVARISWLLKNERNEDQDYEHFEPPFFAECGIKSLNVSRNLTVRRTAGRHSVPGGNDANMTPG